MKRERTTTRKRGRRAGRVRASPLLPGCRLVSATRRGVVLAWLLALSLAHAAERASPVTNATVLAIANRVEVARFGSQVWDPAYIQPTNQVLHPGDRLRTGLDSRALLRLSNLTDFPVGELTSLEIPRQQKERMTLRLLKGIIYFFHRDRPGEFQVETPTVSAVVRGTEFNLEVAEDGTSRFQLLDGELSMSNEFGGLVLHSGQEAIAAPGKAPVQTAVITARPADVVQWRLYYPGILHLPELRLPADARQRLAQSLGAYRSGDLPGAVAAYPPGRHPESDDEMIFRAGLWLAVGKVPEAEGLLARLRENTAEPRLSGLATALQTLIAAVKFRTASGQLSGLTWEASDAHTQLATAWLAESYASQSRFDLEAARGAARRAVAMAPDFAFAWTQLAELEFGFGHVDEALKALKKSLALAPDNAQAHALKGFLLAAGNRTAQAMEAFYRAIVLDGALGNAWLGRGLSHIRLGHPGQGLQDLLAAATLEPQRGILRSYLGKAFSHAGDLERALHELELARDLDPRDPTAYLYSALIKQRANRINEAIRDLEKSAQLNDNRRVYRSRLLLDQDRAVRGANLATLYQDAGMDDVSLREAARAVNYDYTDYAAHLFLGGSYNALRDPRGFNLRYETAWLSEYLVANLLAPVGAGLLSPEVTQQEYTRLFERNRLGLVSETEYRSRGDWVQNAVQYGIFENVSYSLEEAYRSEHGFRPNNDLEALTATLRFKQQVTREDNLFLQASYYTGESGDLAQYFYQTNAQRGLRVKETQEPLLLAGWHHQWSPASHTLFFGGYWRDNLSITNPEQPILFLRRIPPDQISGVPAGGLPTAPFDYDSRFEGFTAEGQHILRASSHTVVVGARFQGGQFDTSSRSGPSSPVLFVRGNDVSSLPFVSPGATNSASGDFRRFGVYAYDTWEIVEPLLLTAGVAYDYLRYPANFRDPPVSADEKSTDRVSPKAGLIWTPLENTVLRAAYTRSLGGVSFEQSFRLEPSQVAGFNQAFRGLIPESAAGSLSAARFETKALSLEQKIGTGTYLGVQLEWLSQNAERDLGEIDLVSIFPTSRFAFTNALRNRLEYEERNISATVNQLLGRGWSLGARYRFSEADLISELEIPAAVAEGRRDLSATLHEVNLFALFHHRSGFFGQLESIWMHQRNSGYTPGLPSDNFWQFNAFVGYRLFQRRLEVRLGLLNLTDEDYRLNPLNLRSELPRERTFVASVRLAF